MTGAQNNQDTSNTVTGTIGGAVGVGLGVVALLSVAVIVVVLCVKKKRERKVIVSQAGDTEGFTNEMYGGKHSVLWNYCEILMVVSANIALQVLLVII